MDVQDRTLEEHKKLVEKIMKRDRKRQRKIDAAGLDYECPEVVRSCYFTLFFNFLRGLGTFWPLFFFQKFANYV